MPAAIVAAVMTARSATMTPSGSNRARNAGSPASPRWKVTSWASIDAFARAAGVGASAAAVNGTSSTTSVSSCFIARAYQDGHHHRARHERIVPALV